MQLIFSRFDPHAKAEIIRDQETGDSLQYAFVEFDTEKACNEAYFKMNNALVDDRRIKVDFSQSVAKEWSKYTQMKRRMGTTQHHFQDKSQRNADGSFLKRDKHRQQFNDNLYNRKGDLSLHRRNHLRSNSTHQMHHEWRGYEDQGDFNEIPSDRSGSDNDRGYNRSARGRSDDINYGERKQSHHNCQDRSEEGKIEQRRRCDSRDYDRRMHRRDRDEKYHRRSTSRKSSRYGDHDRDRRKSSKRKSSRDRGRKDYRMDRDEKYCRKSSKRNSRRDRYREDDH